MCIANIFLVHSLSLVSAVLLPSLLGCGSQQVPKKQSLEKQKQPKKILNNQCSSVASSGARALNFGPEALGGQLIRGWHHARGNLHTSPIILGFSMHSKNFHSDLSATMGAEQQAPSQHGLHSTQFSNLVRIAGL